MADFAKDYALGEEFIDAQKETVYLLEAVAAGDPLRIVGVRANSNTLEVRVQTAATHARYVALRAGAANTLAEVLFQGTTKVTFAADVTPGETCVPSGGKFANNGHAGSGNPCGFIISDGAAADDTGLIYFDGGRS